MAEPNRPEPDPEQGEPDPRRKEVMTWRSGFFGHVKDDPGAREAWVKLRDAGLTEASIRLLADYAGVGPDVPRYQLNVDNALSRIDAAIRAEATADERSQDPRRGMFEARRKDAEAAALDSAWPADGDVKTLGDALRRDGLDGPLSSTREAFLWSAGPRSPLRSPNYFLFLLQGYAERYSVQLGLKLLSSLAACACPSRKLDEGTLGRYFRRLGPVREDILRDTLLLLPRPNPSSK